MNENGKYKHEALLEYIKGNIESGLWSPGEKIPSEPEISKKFNLSRNTIRQAMRDLENAGCLQRIQGKGTFVSEKKSSLSTRIALVIYDLNYMTHPFTGKMIKGIGETLSKKGFALEILTTGQGAELFSELRYAGFIFGAYQTERKLIAEAIEKNIPFVFAKNYLPGLKMNAVLFDYEKAGFMLASHLLSHGHRKIALLAAGKIPISEEFTTGVEKAFSAKKQTLDKSDIFNIGFSAENAAALVGQLSEYSAVITMDDDIAIELVRQFRAIGKNVPDDISVTGCNDIDAASLFSPGITTARLPIYELGCCSAEKLLGIISENDGQNNALLEPVLIERDSVKRLK